MLGENTPAEIGPICFTCRNTILSCNAKTRTLKVVWNDGKHNWHHDFEITSPPVLSDVLVVHVSELSMDALLVADYSRPIGDSYSEDTHPETKCDECPDSLWCDIRDQLKNHIRCSEITLKGYRDYLHDMRIVTKDGKLYRGVPGAGFTGKWEMLYKHKTGDVWVDVQNYQIKFDLNRLAAEGKSGQIDATQPVSDGEA